MCSGECEVCSVKCVALSVYSRASQASSCVARLGGVSASGQAQRRPPGTARHRCEHGAREQPPRDEL